MKYESNYHTFNIWFEGYIFSQQTQIRAMTCSDNKKTDANKKGV